MANKKQEKNEFYNLLPIGLKKSKGLTLTQKNVLAVLIYLKYTYSIETEKNDGWFYQNLNGLVEITNLSKPTILSSLLVLKQKEFISIETGCLKEAKANKYKINHFLLHKYEGKSTKTSVKNDDDNFTDKGEIDNIDNQLVNTIENTETSVKNDDNFTDKQDETSVKKIENNLTTVTVTDLNNNIYNQYITNICNQYMNNIIENIEKIEKTNKDLLLKLNQIEKEITVLKNQFSGLKESNRLFEHRLRLLENEIMPKEEIYDNSDLNEVDTYKEFSITSPKPNNMSDEEYNRKCEEYLKSITK